MQIEVKGTFWAILGSVSVLALSFGLAPFLRCSAAAAMSAKNPAVASALKPALNLNVQAEQGRSLFARNCAHCHGDDARGDEGPTLYSLPMSDARIARRIKDGIKGEMPRFGSKLNDTDIAALTAWLRTLKD